MCVQSVTVLHFLLNRATPMGWGRGGHWDEHSKKKRVILGTILSSQENPAIC